MEDVNGESSVKKGWGGGAISKNNTPGPRSSEKVTSGTVLPYDGLKSKKKRKEKCERGRWSL